jgi:competence protein ComEC
MAHSGAERAVSAESADSDESAESARQGDLAGRSVGGRGRSWTGDGRRRHWQRYVDAAALVPARAEYGGQAAAARAHEPVGAVPEVRSPQPGGFTPGRRVHGPSGSAARPGDPFAGRLSENPAGRFGDSAAGRLSAHLTRQLRSRTATGGASRRSLAERKRRTDLRLALPALMVWGTAVAGNWWPPAALAVLCAGMATAAGILLVPAGRKKAKRNNAKRIQPVRIQPGRLRKTPTRTVPTSTTPAKPGREGVRRPSVGRGTVRHAPRPEQGARRSFDATLALALLLSVAAGAHAAVDASRRSDGAIAAAVAARAAVVAELDVAGAPRRLRTPGAGGLADRWAVPVTLKAMVFEGHRAVGEARLVVMGGRAWEHAAAGQRLRVTGRLRPAAPGEPDAGILSASSDPTVLRGPAPWQQGPGELRKHFTTAAAKFGTDAGGLLPGMVTGDTSALDTDLEGAMRTVGMTHLTAVSGANCSLILGTLLLAARTLRLPRTAAAVASLAGLGLFVLMVGPDPSVLRAALMGGIGLTSVAFGRAARGLPLLCVAVIGLLLAQPDLAASFGFLLSVLATLGIVVSGRRIMDWLPPVVPRWAAAGIGVPLSAQLFCAPAIVILQPQLGVYTLPANMAAAVLVAPVTLLGTAGAALLPAVPGAAEALMAAAAVFAGGVAGTARFFASLPGAALPWPEGAFGAATMSMLSACMLAAVWLALHPAAVVRAALAAHVRIVAVLEASSRVTANHDARPAPLPGVRRGLEHRSGRGTLRVRNVIPGRNHEWLLPRPNGPGPRRRRAPPGAM